MNSNPDVPNPASQVNSGFTLTWRGRTDRPASLHVRPMSPSESALLARRATEPEVEKHDKGLNKNEYCQALAEYAVKLMGESVENKARAAAIHERIRAIRASSEPIQILSR